MILSRNVDIYLFDELIGGVGPAVRDIILDTIHAFKNSDATFILSTHQIYDVEILFDEVIFLKQGEVYLHLSTKSLIKAHEPPFLMYLRRCLDMMVIKRLPFEMYYGIGNYIVVMGLFYALTYLEKITGETGLILIPGSLFYFGYLVIHLSHLFSKGIFTKNAYVLFSLPLSMRELLLSKWIAGIFKATVYVFFFIYCLSLSISLTTILIAVALIVVITVSSLVITLLMFAGILTYTVYQGYGKRVLKTLLLFTFLLGTILFVIYQDTLFNDHIIFSSIYFVLVIGILLPFPLFFFSALMLDKRLEL